MDPRAALLQQESEENNRFRNRSIGMHNLRAKLREQLKGYSHVRGFPLESDSKRNADNADGRTESLNVRRDSMRRRTSSVTRQQNRYDPEDSDSENKYKQRRSRKRESLLIPRLLWFSVYVSLCYVAYRGLKYFGGETEVALCQPCAGGNQCGVLDDEFVIPVDNLGGLAFGTVFPKKSQLYCRTDMCVPSHVADPQALCRMVSDEALLYRTRRLLQDGDDSSEQSKRFQEYFRRRAMREEGLAVSPTGETVTPSTSTPSTPSDRGTPSNPPTDRGTPSTPNNPPTDRGTPSTPSNPPTDRGTPSTPSNPPTDGGTPSTPSNQGTSGNTPSNQPQDNSSQSRQSDPNVNIQQSQSTSQDASRTQPADTSRAQSPDSSKAQSPDASRAQTPDASKALSPNKALSPASGDLVQGNLANGAFSARRNALVVSLRALPEDMYMGGGACNTTLRYEPTRQEGYANLTTDYYKVITQVENFGQCCAICANEKDCTSWTRVAGGDASVLQCYLHSDMIEDPNVASRAHNWQPNMPVYPENPAVRYTLAVPIMFESGTKRGDELPSQLYGCPYPPAADGSCQVPVGCNCGGGQCYPGCVAPTMRGNAGGPDVARAAPAAKTPATAPVASKGQGEGTEEGLAPEALATALADAPSTATNVPAADLADALANSQE